MATVRKEVLQTNSIHSILNRVTTLGALLAGASSGSSSEYQLHLAAVVHQAAPGPATLLAVVVMPIAFWPFGGIAHDRMTSHAVTGFLPSKPCLPGQTIGERNAPYRAVTVNRNTPGLN